MTVIGNDVVASYPSLEAMNTARLVGNRIMKSKIQFEGFDDRKERVYIQMKRDILEDLDAIAQP